MIEGIIHNSLGEANSLNTRVHARMQGKKKELRYKATSFFAVIKHPTEDQWVSIINRNTITPVWTEVLAELSPGELDSIETIPADWFATTDPTDEKPPLLTRMKNFITNIFKS